MTEPGSFEHVLSRGLALHGHLSGDHCLDNEVDGKCYESMTKRRLFVFITIPMLHSFFFFSAGWFR